MHELGRLPLHKRLFKSNAKFENEDLKNDYLFQHTIDAKMLSYTLDILNSYNINQFYLTNFCIDIFSNANTKRNCGQ